jgi:UDP-N-acetylmuramate--alanine ligase
MKVHNISAHFIGIGGISMSALALILQGNNCIVSGSDLVANPQVDMLRTQGIEVHIGHARGNIPRSCDLVVYTSAIAPNNPELEEAYKRSIEAVTREELLGHIESTYKTRIAVAGTHGKSTTVAMLADIFCASGLDPTVHNGALMKSACGGGKQNLRRGDSEIFITEACEFKRSFLKLSPTIAVVTNIDCDHMDCYRDLLDVQETFRAFAAKSDTVIVNADCENSQGVHGKGKTITFGVKCDAMVRAIEISEHEAGKFSFQLCAFGKTTPVRLSVAGFHNIYNALASAAAAFAFSISPDVIAEALSSFVGIARRFEEIPGGFPTCPNCKLIIDYAHHPAELRATIETARAQYDKFLLVFQPHTYTRTLYLFDDFVSVLSTADCLLYKTYAAREKPIAGGRAFDLHRRISGSRYFATANTLRNYLAHVAKNYDAIILTGAGDINELFLIP